MTAQTSHTNVVGFSSSSLLLQSVFLMLASCLHDRQHYWSFRILALLNVVVVLEISFCVTTDSVLRTNIEIDNIDTLLS